METIPMPTTVVQRATPVGKKWGGREQNHINPRGHLLQSTLKSLRWWVHALLSSDKLATNLA